MRAEKSHARYPLSQALPLTCALDKTLGEKKTKVKRTKIKPTLFLILHDDKYCFSLSWSLKSLSLPSSDDKSDCYASIRP